MAEGPDRRLGIAPAATALGVSKDTMRRRIRRGELDAVRDNKGQWLVRLPMGTAVVPRQRVEGRANRQPAPMPAPMQAHVDVLVQQMADLQRRLDEAAAERAQLLRLLEAAQRALAERPARRPWPGLKAWWRRLVEGEE